MFNIQFRNKKHLGGLINIVFIFNIPFITYKIKGRSNSTLHEIIVVTGWFISACDTFVVVLPIKNDVSWNTISPNHTQIDLLLFSVIANCLNQLTIPRIRREY